MKYAFIALIAIYLFSYGCIPDTPEKPKASHEQTATVTAENSHASEPVAVSEQEQQQQESATDDVVIIETTEGPADVAEEATEEQLVEPEMVVMPCGRQMALADIPPDAPCLNGQPMGIQGPVATDDKHKDVLAAMQKVVDATNDMVMVTRQLVIATQEMLNASNAAAVKAAPAEEPAPAN